MTRNVEAIYHVTPLQHGMLYHSLRERGSGIYVEQFSCVIEGPLHRESFESAWSAVVHRHDVLRTLFIRLHDREPLQVVRKEAAVSFVCLDWQGASPAEQETRFAALLAEDRRQGIDLSRAPLMRWHWIAVGPDLHRFLWTYHHAILDGWSMPVILNEVLQVYSATASGCPASLPRPAPYRNYVSWLRAQDTSKAMAYWRECLQGFRSPLAFAPSMKPRGSTENESRKAHRQLATARSHMPVAWREQATQVCRAQKITLNTLCQGAWSLLLGSYCDTDDLVYGTVISGRPLELAGVESMVGLFINTLPLRIRIEKDAVLVDWLRKLQSVNMDIERHGYSALAEIQNAASLSRQQSLFDSLYVFENYPGQAQLDRIMAAHGVRIRDVRAVEETNYPLALIVVPQDGLTILMTYDTALFSQSAVEALTEDYRRLLNRMLDLAGTRVSDIRLDGGMQLAQTDSTPASGPEDRSLLTLLLQHASSHPEQIAYSDGTRAMSYGQLVWLLARYCQGWRKQGYRPGDRVWLNLDDDLLSLVALLSGLACGIECVLLEQGTPESVLQQASGGRGGLSELAGCICSHSESSGLPVATRDSDVSITVADLQVARKTTHAPSAQQVATLGLKCTVFPWIDEPLAETHFDESEASLNCSGAVLIAHGDAQNDWEILKYDEPAALSAIAWFTQTYPVVGSRCVPVAGAVLRAANLWTTLLALGSGLTVRSLGSCTDAGFLETLHQLGDSWHSVRMSALQTRMLSTRVPPSPAPAIRSDYVVVDAMTATQRALAHVRSICGGALLVKELRFPAYSLPHAWLASGPELSGSSEFLSRLGNPVSGSKLFLLDRHLHLTGTHAFGRVGVSGSSVPAAQLGDANGAQIPSPLPNQSGSILLTDIKAWHSGNHSYAEMPSASPAFGARDPRVRAIEQCLVGLTGIEDAAIIERVTEAGEWESAVFYIAPGDAQANAEDRIRETFTEQKLIPGALIRLEHLPRAGTRVNRHALLRGDVALAKQDTYAPPRDDVERKLQAMWQELLKRERIGVRDNYFELGGQSLLATVLLFKIEEELSHTVNLDLFLEYPTIEGLAKIIRGEMGADATQPKDLALEVQLADDIAPSTAFDAQAFEAYSIFLTGATGFLGVHLLTDLLEKTAADIYCLLKVPDAQSGIQLLTQTLTRYGLWNERFRSRLHAVPGELEKPLFGLTEAQFSALAQTVDLIYHNAAGGNFVYPYGALKRVNVLAVQDVLRLACTHRTKPVHYVSTADVLNRSREADEELSVPLHSSLASGYEQSKWVAEQIICLASQRGLPVTIYRPTRIGGHSQTGVSNLDDLFSRMVKGIVELGKAPHDAGVDNIVPVDVVSRIIVESSLSPRVYGRAIHVANPVSHRIDDVVDYIEKAGFPVERVDFDTWLQELSGHVKQNREHPLAMLVPVLQRLKSAREGAATAPKPISLANVTALLGERALDLIGRIETLLPVYFDYFHAVGYLPKQERPVTERS